MYERIDGQVRGTLRQAAIDRFSKPGTVLLHVYYRCGVACIVTCILYMCICTIIVIHVHVYVLLQVNKVHIILYILMLLILDMFMLHYIMCISIYSHLSSSSLHVF